MTRWLAIVYEEACDDEELWLKLIEFLEKKLKVQQQKVLIQGKTEDKKIRLLNDEKGNMGRSHFAGDLSPEPKCYFHNESEDHVATNGPRETKIVQYFARKKFAEMSPNERFKEL